jgi:hypothetical protein
VYLVAFVLQVALLLLPLLGRPAAGASRITLELNTQAALACLLLLSLLQLLLLRKHLAVYLRYRHCITLSIRAMRATAGFLPALNHSGDVMTTWGKAGQQRAAVALVVYTVFPSLMHLQVFGSLLY